MLCHKYKCIYIHIPKTAGKSIQHVFAKQLGLGSKKGSDLLLGMNDNPALGPPELSHLKISEYVQFGHLSQEQFDSYFKFAFVRNPWDRMVSEYKFRGYPRKTDFKTYLLNHLPKPSWTDRYIHTIPQYDFLFDDSGNLLVDYLGKFERLKKDFDEVCRRIGISQVTLPHKNISSRALKFPWTLKGAARILINMASIKRKKNIFNHYTEYYDDESRELVADLYKQDIETFGYEFGK
jgi:hypothetical protein